MRWLVGLCLAFAQLAAQAAVTIEDDRGLQVTFAKPPQRIVSLLPSVTETI